MKVLLSIMVTAELPNLENRKLSYQGNIGVVMCLQCCMNGAGVWKIYNGGFSFTGH